MKSDRRVDLETLWPAALLLALSSFVICFRLGSYSLVNGDEAIYHAIAQHMVASGDWLTLDFKGEHRVWDTLMNAPIQYWVRASLISLFGDSLWIARIPSALCGVASILMTYRLVLHLATREIAFLAACVQLTTFQFVYLHSARTGELDAALTLLLTAAAHLFVRSVESQRSFVAHHVCLVLILNLKTPTIAIPIAAELACFALLPALRSRFRDWLICSAWMLPLGLSWHLTQLALLWDPVWKVVAQMGAKAAGEASLASRIVGNASYYASTLLFGAFPYSLAYPLALFAVLRSRSRESGWRWIVLALFIAALFTFYLPVAERNHWYVIPAYPFLSAFVAAWIFSLATRRISAVALFGVALLIASTAWLEVDATSFNPFAEQANRIDMETRFRAHGIAPLLGVAFGTAALGALLAALQARFLDVAPRIVAASLAALMLGVGATRILAPFAYLGHQSEMAEIRARIDAARATGDPLRTPIAVGEPLGGRASFYFADEFELVPVRSRTNLPQPIFFQLIEKTAPDDH